MYGEDDKPLEERHGSGDAIDAGAGADGGADAEGAGAPEGGAPNANVPEGDASAASADESGGEPGAGADAASVPDDSASSADDDRPRKGRRVVLLVLCIVVALGCGVFLGVSWLQSRQSASVYDGLSQAAGANGTNGTGNTIANPVDFAALQEQNPDIVGWITIPNTEVDYPILQSPTDDFYYLTHDPNGNITLGGSIYMQMANSAAFTDPVTVLYGHNVSDNSMFTSLHYFENADFFRDNEDMTICIPGHVLSYRIIATYIYDDRHILNSFDFGKEAVRTEYFASVLNPVSLVANVRDGATLAASDKIVQLSTCLDAWTSSNSRLIVTGVLVNDQLTH